MLIVEDQPTKINGKFKVIEIKKDDKVGFLAGTSCFDQEAVVQDITQAILYTDEKEVSKPLGNLYITNFGGAKSGVRADSAMIIEVEFESNMYKEISRSVGR